MAAATSPLPLRAGVFAYQGQVRLADGPLHRAYGNATSPASVDLFCAAHFLVPAPGGTVCSDLDCTRGSGGARQCDFVEEGDCQFGANDALANTASSATIK